MTSDASIVLRLSGKNVDALIAACGIAAAGSDLGYSNILFDVHGGRLVSVVTDGYVLVVRRWDHLAVERGVQLPVAVNAGALADALTRTHHDSATLRLTSRHVHVEWDDRTVTTLRTGAGWPTAWQSVFNTVAATEDSGREAFEFDPLLLRRLMQVTGNARLRLEWHGASAAWVFDEHGLVSALVGASNPGREFLTPPVVRPERAGQVAA